MNQRLLLVAVIFPILGLLALIGRADWLADRAHWAGRAGAVEERLSDALHLSLTQRFVDKRTTMLLRQIGANPRDLPVTIGEQGEVMVEVIR